MDSFWQPAVLNQQTERFDVPISFARNQQASANGSQFTQSPFAGLGNFYTPYPTGHAQNVPNQGPMSNFLGNQWGQMGQGNGYGNYGQQGSVPFGNGFGFGAYGRSGQPAVGSLANSTIGRFGTSYGPRMG